jgi:Protein of unknown function (DUF2917)
MVALSLVAAAAARLSAQRQLREYVVAGARALWHAGRSAMETIRPVVNERRCFVYAEVVMRRGGLLRIEHARGLTVVVGDGRVWLTQDHQARDVQMEGGSQAVIDGDGMAVASTDRDTRVTLCGEVSERMPWRITQVLRCGLRREVCARDASSDLLELPLPVSARFRTC